MNIIKRCVIFLLILLSGCSALTGSGRFIEPPELPPAGLGLQAVGEDIKAVLHYVIVPGGPGSWVKGATWNEMVISLQNESRGDVTIKRISLIDSRGLYVNPESPNVLPSAADYTEKMQGMSLLTQGVGVAGTLLSAFTGMPLLGILSGAFIVNAPGAQVSADVKEMERLIAEVKKRQLSWPLEMSPGSLVRGSQFFTVANPKALVVTYQTSKGEKQVRLALDSTAFLASSR
jgi:hypothetical protein